ncbi:MAG: protein-L-isoaspartate(D-aspartate) O-methyltransferase [Planctomycetes bacterium]|nr:protein-L-isoaspartate(D-aspartate) O-methyltransferase [Planctomycetota bacterium]
MNPSQRDRMLDTIRQQFARTAARTGLAAPGPGVEAAIAATVRAEFVPPEQRRRAYDDAALPLSCGQTISQPFLVALMTTLLRPQRHHRVLEVGTGSGYQAAVLGRLVQDVHTVERVPELAATAAERLRALGHANVHVRCGDGGAGWPEHAPYDGILVACGGTAVPPALLEQLAPGGHLVMPVGPRDDQRLLDVQRDAHGDVHTRDVLEVRFVPFVHAKPAPRRERTVDAHGVVLRATAAERAEAFGQLALALAEVVADPARVRRARQVAFACSAPTQGQLLSRWLDEVLWAMRRQRLVFAGFDVELAGDSLRAIGAGEPLDATRHRPQGDPAELVVSDAALTALPDGWAASCRLGTAAAR